MVFIFGGILEGIKQSWHYVTSSVNRGLTATQSYIQIKRAGLAVSESLWKESYDTFRESQNTWKKIMEVPEYYKIGEQLAVKSPFDWKRQHIMKMKINAVDVNTGKWVEQWITVENDTALSKREWLLKADDAVMNSPFGYSYHIQYVSEYEYYQKGA